MVPAITLRHTAREVRSRIPNVNSHAEEKSQTHHHAERSIVLESLLLAAVALLVLNFHPFGSAHLRRHFSQDLIYAWFGDAQWLYPRRAQPRAVVILVDDAALAARGAMWPVPLGFDAQLLAEIDVLRPRAVMLDFLILNRAPARDVCALLTTAARLRAEGTSLYLAVTGREDLDWLAQTACADAAGHALDPGQLFVPVSVSRQVDEADFTSRRYPFEEHAADDAQGPLESAAVRMYCDASSDSTRCAANLTRGLAPDAGFELAWSPSGDPFNRRWSQNPCRNPASALHVLIDRAELPRVMACPPIATLFASALLNPAQDQGLGPNNEKLFALLQGSFVFVGGNFRGSGDLITTPMHTFLPGVYYHAMAFENLAMFDGRPKVREEFRSFKIGIFLYDLMVLWALAVIFLWRERRNRGGAPVTHHGGIAPSDSASDWFAGWIARLPVAVSLGLFVLASLVLAAYPWMQIIGFLAAVLALVGVEVLVSSRLEFGRLLRSTGLYAAALGMSFGVVALAVWFGYRWLRLPPGDWVGYLSFATVGFFVAHTAIVDFGRRIGSLRRTAPV